MYECKNVIERRKLVSGYSATTLAKPRATSGRCGKLFVIKTCPPISDA